MLKVAVILGSVRKARFGEKPAQWILGDLQKNPEIKVELLDLRDFDLPAFDEPVSPGWIGQPYKNEAVARWTQKIAANDAFVIVTPEYNHSVPSGLKNAIDWVYAEWTKKPIGFVSYGAVGGARAVEHLRGIAVELQMAPVRTAVHLPLDLYISMMKDPAPVDPARFKPVEHAAHTMIEQLLWWGKALNEARRLEAEQKAREAEEKAREVAVEAA
jgi:NAD(P)H-dependent FMN reductase